MNTVYIDDLDVHSITKGQARIQNLSISILFCLHECNLANCVSYNNHHNMLSFFLHFPVFYVNQSNHDRNYIDTNYTNTTATYDNNMCESISRPECLLYFIYYILRFHLKEKCLCG